jgi:hypothetical protein
MIVEVNMPVRVYNAHATGPCGREGIVTCIKWLQTRFGLVIEHLKIVITSHCNSLSGLHHLKITASHINPSLYVSW